MRENMKTLEIANLSLREGGGAYRAWGVIKHRRETGVKCHSLLFGFDERTKDAFRVCPSVGFARPIRILLSGVIPSSLRELVFASAPPKITFEKSMLKNIFEVDIVICHHETADALNFSLDVSEELNVKKAAILQLPPFYAEKSRLKMILGSYVLFRRLTSASMGINDLIHYAYQTAVKRAFGSIVSRRVKKMLRKFDLLIAVSKSIPIEMGWDDVIALDPGTGFYPEELTLIRSLRGRVIDKYEYDAIFPARLDPTKGLADLVLAIKMIVRSRSSFRIVITGSGDPRVVSMLQRSIKRLGLERNVVLKGFMKREELFKMKRASKLMIYPSHIDSYSYSVAENLILGRPVVAYDIPALRVNYGGLEGIYLVREGDVEALAQKALEILETRDVSVEEPRVKTFIDIAYEEKIILEKFLKHGDSRG